MNHQNWKQYEKEQKAVIDAMSSFNTEETLVCIEMSDLIDEKRKIDKQIEVLQQRKHEIDEYLNNNSQIQKVARKLNKSMN